MPFSESIETPLQPLEHALFEHYKIQVWIKRDDLNHPTIQGNKWHKLRHNLEAAKKSNKTQLITFGGAYSNHIAATAAAGKMYGFETIGFIRGEELATCPQHWSHTLIEAQKKGMSLNFLSRAVYRQKSDAEFMTRLEKAYPNGYIIPEGGTNLKGVKGFKPLMQNLEKQCPEWTHLFCAVGTGGTLAGMIRYAQTSKTATNEKVILGVATLKNADYLRTQITELSQPTFAKQAINWQLLTQYCGDGYAKPDSKLLDLNTWFKTSFNIELDPIYTVKMVNGFLQELEKGTFPKGAKVILYHSGGLQGIAPNC